MFCATRGFAAFGFRILVFQIFVFQIFVFRILVFRILVFWIFVLRILVFRILVFRILIFRILFFSERIRIFVFGWNRSIVFCSGSRMFSRSLSAITCIADCRVFAAFPNPRLSLAFLGTSPFVAFFWIVIFCCAPTQTPPKLE